MEYMLYAQGWREGSSTESIAKKDKQKHAKSQAQIAAGKILAEQKERKMETVSLKSVDHSRELTEKFCGPHILLATITDHSQTVQNLSHCRAQMGSSLVQF